MTFALDALRRQVDDIFDDVVKIRRDIHMHPELSEQEILTEEKICAWLDELDIPYERNIAGHGVCATVFGQNSTNTAGIRADIDALPVTEQTGLPYSSLHEGVMHACGHDMHTAILLGVAKILKENTETLPGTVKLMFQPAEETIGGAERMIKAGCLKNPDVNDIISLHVNPSHECGTLEFVKGYMNASTCEFRLTVKGKSCHGAHPDTGIDVLPPACAIVSALQSIITRNLSPTTPVIITVGTFHSGTACNIISGEAKLTGTIRTLDLDVREFVKERVRETAVSTARAFGADCEVEFEDGYPPLKNSDELFALLSPVMEESFGKENIIYTDFPSMGGDDFAYFTQCSRGLYFNLGVHDPAETECFSLHNEHFAPMEEALRIGMLAELIAVYTILESKI